MPPRASLTGSFSVSDENNVVVCPLRNHDGSACRKRCTGVSALAHVMPLALARTELAKSVADSMGAGKTIPLHARAHPPRAPGALHLEAPRYRGELHADGQHPATTDTAAAAPSHHNWPRLVPTSLQLSGD
ncbi:hypothetical protein DPSP01_007562 [Paraphaeosphaeria sporulosa]